MFHNEFMFNTSRKNKKHSLIYFEGIQKQLLHKYYI